MSNPKTATVYLSGPIDGTGEAHPNGDYYKLTIGAKGEPIRQFKITGEQVSEIKEICEVLEHAASL